MGKLLLQRFGPGLIALLMTSFSFGADSDATSGLHRGVKAKPIKRSAPRYPQNASSRGQQGWVQLSYVVTPEGQIADPIIADSSGSSVFERAAVRTVKNWSYEPATWNGEPVQQCHTDVMIIFAMEGAGTKVSKTFSRHYARIEKTISAGKLSKAQKMVDELVIDLNLSLSETAWLWSLRARLAGLTGDKDAQLTALRRATANNGHWVDDQLYPRLLLVRTALELEKGNFSEALSSHDRLVETDLEHAQLDVLAPYVDSLRDLVASEETLSVPARVGAKEGCADCATNWHYQPLRRKFSLSDVTGSLRDIEFRCTWQRVVDKAVEGVTWEVPEDWGNCSIIVFGEPGTTFNLLELPIA